MMSKPFNAKEVRDGYREALLSVIEKKLEGAEIEEPVAVTPKNTDNLMDSLMATMAAIKAAKK